MEDPGAKRKGLTADSAPCVPVRREGWLLRSAPPERLPDVPQFCIGWPPSVPLEELLSQVRAVGEWLGVADLLGELVGEGLEVVDVNLAGVEAFLFLGLVESPADLPGPDGDYARLLDAVAGGFMDG